MLGRSAVSYQNISPSSDIFSGSGNCVNYVLSSNINGTLRNTKSLNRPGYGFKAEDNKGTTNVAWLVGAARGLTSEDSSHHLDIDTQDSVLPPPHLAVAPLTNLVTSVNNNSNQVVTSVNNNNNIRMGYSLCRSKTVSDIPCWEGDNHPGDEGDHNDKKKSKRVRRSPSSVNNTPVNREKTFSVITNTPGSL